MVKWFCHCDVGIRLRGHQRVPQRGSCLHLSHPGQGEDWTLASHCSIVWPLCLRAHVLQGPGGALLGERAGHGLTLLCRQWALGSGQVRGETQARSGCRAKGGWERTAKGGRRWLGRRAAWRGGRGACKTSSRWPAEIGLNWGGQRDQEACLGT